MNKPIKTNLPATIAFLGLIATVFASSTATAQMKGQVNDFEDGSNQNWVEGPLTPNAPTNNPTGGPGGAGDNYLDDTSARTQFPPGPGGKMMVQNQMVPWTGDYVAAGINKICAHARVQNTSEMALSLRIGFQLETLQRFGSLTPFVVPRDNNWYEVMFPINPTSLDPAGLPLPTYNQVMTSVSRFRIFHSPGTFDWRAADEVDATMGLDNIRAWGSTGDADGDCRSDLIWHNMTTGQLVHWGMNGGAIKTHSAGPQSDIQWEVRGDGDFNGDGYADVLWQSTSTTEVIIWLMTGSANGASILSQSSVGFTFGAGWTIVGDGDMDGDGMADILFRNTISGVNVVWLMNGGKRKSMAALITVSDQNWQVASDADRNGDGIDDLLWRNSLTGANSLWIMNGHIRTQHLLLPAAGNQWNIVGDGDQNGDGKPDILWRGGGGMAVWLMDGATLIDNVALPSVADDAWLVSGHRDYDGDGDADIMWYQTLDGYVAYWDMDGTMLFSNVFVATIADAFDWRIQNPK